MAILLSMAIGYLLGSMSMPWAVWAIGYLLGSMPWAVWIARWRGVDIYVVGTRNPGAANVFRQLGPLCGLGVLLGDTLKGLGAILVARLLGVTDDKVMVLTGATALVGHWYPLFARFRGGVGLATTVGVAYGLSPVSAALATLPALVALRLTRNTGWSAGLGFVAFFLVSWLARQPPLLTLGVMALTLAIALRTFLPRLWRKA